MARLIRVVADDFDDAAFDRIEAKLDSLRTVKVGRPRRVPSGVECEVDDDTTPEEEGRVRGGILAALTPPDPTEIRLAAIETKLDEVLSVVAEIVSLPGNGPPSKVGSESSVKPPKPKATT